MNTTPRTHTIDNRLLKKVFNIQNPSHNRWCNDRAINIIRGLVPAGCTVVRNQGNLLVRKGPASGPHPYFLAHMDQVHQYEPGFRLCLHSPGNSILTARDGNGKQTGVGGDDKCGIYLALAMLHELEHVTAVFVRDEETGCHGSGSVPLTWFDHAAFVIQADRNNRTMDIIPDTNGYCCASDEFVEAILNLPTAKANQHRRAEGSVTDIGELASRGLGVSMVNISSGYHDAHMHTEYVKLDELRVACNLALEAAMFMGTNKWEHVPTCNYSFGGAWGKGESKAYTSGIFFDNAYTLAKSKGKSKGKLPKGYWDDLDEDPPNSSIQDSLEAMEKEDLIEELLDWGYDRQLHNLDIMTVDQLSLMLEECETNDGALIDTPETIH